jgi:ATP-independent RNA helicase DbpA
MTTPFSQLKIDPQQLEVLDSLGFKSMTDIQAASLPNSLAGKDVLAQAPTGSGKTVAFSLPIINNLNPRWFAIQGLVLCPTRELANQVAEEIRRLARYPGNIKVLTLCGGQPIGPQINSLEHGAHIIVGTPGRISDHIRKGTLDITTVNTLVLDEADRMLDMGFKDDILAIVGLTPKTRQSLLFSATIPKDIERIAADVLVTPISVKIAASEQAHIDISQQVFISDDDHTETLLAVLGQHQPDAGLIFCNTREQCNELGKALKQFGVSAGVLHGDMDQRERNQILVRFTNGSLRLLIATDVAARGLDIDSVDLVINFGLPRDLAVFMHRCGRTGRAGRQGLAISIISPKETHKIARINEQYNSDLTPQPAPSLDHSHLSNLRPNMATIEIASGKKHKIRPGDIVGALTAYKQISGSDIGNISVQDFVSYVALPRKMVDLGLDILRHRPLKGKNIRARKI